MQRIILESAPELLIICVVAALAYAGIQYYRSQHPWSKAVNAMLFTFRAVLVFFLSFLLLGPNVKQISNLYEKPAFVILHDNSSSISETTDSLITTRIRQDLDRIQEMLDENGYDGSIQTLSDDDPRNFHYNATTSDINGALKRIADRYEGKNVAGVILVSDGIYNTGLSPLYATYNFPVYTVGVGDTSVRADIALKNISYNKIAYQGNKFPLRAEVQLKN